MVDHVTCMVVDDDRIDSLSVQVFLRFYPFMEVIGQYEAAEPALEAAALRRPDVLFLDIDMPGMDGLELRRRLMDIPACVFITAFADYALDAFDLAALDFLVKPISADRFAQTMGRVEEYMLLRRRSDQLSHMLGADVVYIKEGHERVKVRMDEVLYLEALNNYTGVVTTKKRYMVLSPLGSLLKEDAFSRFVRIHRSFAVQKNFVTRIGTGEVEVQGRALPVGRIYKDALHELDR